MYAPKRDVVIIGSIHARMDSPECVAIARGVYYPAAGLSRSPPVPFLPAPVQITCRRADMLENNLKVRIIDGTYSGLSPSFLYASPPSLPRRIDDRK